MVCCQQSIDRLYIKVSESRDFEKSRLLLFRGNFNMGTQVQSGQDLLQHCRHEIDLLDAELLRLFNQRARLVLELAEVKKSCGLPAYDSHREQQVLECMCRENRGPLERESVMTLFRALIQEFRRIGQSAIEQ